VVFTRKAGRGIAADPHTRHAHFPRSILRDAAFDRLSPLLRMSGSS